MPKKRDADAPYWRWIRNYKQYIIRGALLKADGVVSTAAAQLGISRQGLGKEIAALESFGLSVRDETPEKAENAVLATPEPPVDLPAIQEESPDEHHE